VKKVSILFILLCCVVNLNAQRKKRNFIQHEFGLFGGASYYIGDINPRKHFIYSQPAVGILYRYSTSYRFAHRIGFNFGTVYANDKNSGEANQLERNLSFRSRVYDLHLISEFNFVEYRIGHEKHYMSLFVFGGIGGYYFNPQSNAGGNGYENLEEKRNEGVSYSKIQLSLPFGVGFKWNVTDKMGLAVEWGPRKLFTDYLDDVSSRYLLSGQNSNLAYMRGNPRNKDWYFFYGFSMSFKLRKSRECHTTGM